MIRRREEGHLSLTFDWTLGISFSQMDTLLWVVEMVFNARGADKENVIRTMVMRKDTRDVVIN